MPTPFSAKDNIIAALGLQSLPEAKRIELLNMATELVEKRMFLRLIESLNDADAAAAEAYADKPEELMGFLAEKAGPLETMLDEEVRKVREELVALGVEADAA